MVKNITIKDEAYAFLKAKKGSELSFSDVILEKKATQVKEQAATYGEIMIPVSHQTKAFLDSLRLEDQTYDDVIAHFEKKKPTKSYLALKALYNIATDDDWDLEAIAQNKKDFGRSSHNDWN